MFKPRRLTEIKNLEDGDIIKVGKHFIMVHQVEPQKGYLKSRVSIYGQCVSELRLPPEANPFEATFPEQYLVIVWDIDFAV